jgi:hypothetical protein
MFSGEKPEGTIKGRMVYNGEPTREWLSREDKASPTAALKSIMLTALIDAHKECDIMMCNIIPDASIQALMPEVKDRDERVMMKITGALVNMLVKLNRELYGQGELEQDSSSILTIHVSQTVLRKDRSIRFFFIWMI